MILSCGLSNAVYTAKFAGDPERAWTLTPHSSSFKRNASSARDWHKRSVWSMNSFPP